MATIYGRLLNANSRKGADSSKAIVRMDDVPLESIYSNDGNFYPMDDIQGLAQKIYMVGLVEPLAVKRAPCDRGEYCLISGERRWRALKFLAEQGAEGFERVSVCIRSTKDFHEEQIELIVSNAYRSKDAATLLREEKALKEHLEHMKENNIPLNGYDLQKGRLRDIVADMLNVSPTKVGELEAIRHHLSPEFMEKVEEGRLNASTAYSLSKLSDDEQADMMKVFEEKETLSARDIAEYKEMRQEEACQEEQLGGLQKRCAEKPQKEGDFKEQQKEACGPDETGARQEEIPVLSKEPGKAREGKVPSFSTYLMREHGISVWKYVRDKLPCVLSPELEKAVIHMIYELTNDFKKYIEKETGNE